MMLHHGVIPLATRAATAASIFALGVFSVSFVTIMDANPTLYLYDKFIVNNKFGIGRQKRKLLHNHFGGKNIWIVGGSSGIGLELVQKLSSYGANVIVSSRRRVLVEPSSSSSLTTEGDTGVCGTISFVPLDITGSIDEMNQAIDSVQTILATSNIHDEDGNISSNNLDYIILNAGRGQLSTAADTAHETTKEIFQVNTLGLIAITQLLLQRGILSVQPNESRKIEDLAKTSSMTTQKKNTFKKQERKCSRLIVTSSVGARFGLPLSSSYAASKHALHGYYRSLHAENPSLKIDLICPGPIDTPFHSTNHIKNDDRDDDDNNNKKKEKKRDLKMDVKRCVALMISSMMMNHHHSRQTTGGGCCKETWIAEQPTLLGLYINQYVPSMFQNFMLSKIGPLRVKAFQQGKNLYDPDTWTKK